MIEQVLWVAGHHTSIDHLIDNGWELIGVYDSEVKAVAACISWRDFVGPQVLNKTNPEETTEWEGCYYPMQRIADDK